MYLRTDQLLQTEQMGRVQLRKQISPLWNLRHQKQLYYFYSTLLYLMKKVLLLSKQIKINLFCYNMFL